MTSSATRLKCAVACARHSKRKRVSPYQTQRRMLTVSCGVAGIGRHRSIVHSSGTEEKGTYTTVLVYKKGTYTTVSRNSNQVSHGPSAQRRVHAISRKSGHHRSRPCRIVQPKPRQIRTARHRVRTQLGARERALPCQPPQHRIPQNSSPDRSRYRRI